MAIRKMDDIQIHGILMKMYAPIINRKYKQAAIRNTFSNIEFIIGLQIALLTESLLQNHILHMCKFQEISNAFCTYKEKLNTKKMYLSF